MKSMTGYGKARLSRQEIEFTAEIKSVNNRYLDINCKMPRLLLLLEDEVRKIIASRIKRGRIDVYISFSDNRKKDVAAIADINLAKGYLNAAKALSEELGILNDITVSRLLEYDILKVESEDIDVPLYKEILSACVIEAVNQLNLMREAEGVAIKADMLVKIEAIKELTQNIEERAPQTHRLCREKLKQRITEALEGVEYDETRLLNEVAFYVDKYNIDEEITRLKSHIKQFTDMLKENGVGKKIDFLVQEINREANTICSKSQDSQITNYALELKNEIEKIREQVQNIE
jgi:uncharacterized protein (TIGR00255 family)